MKELKPILVFTVLLIFAGKIKTKSKVSAVQNITISQEFDSRIALDGSFSPLAIKLTTFAMLDNHNFSVD